LIEFLPSAPKLALDAPQIDLPRRPWDVLLAANSIENFPFTLTSGALQGTNGNRRHILANSAKQAFVEGRYVAAL